MEVQAFYSSFEKGAFSNALAHCDKLIEQESKVAIHYCNRARIYYELELYRKCIKDCDAAIQLDPHAIKAYLLKGLALFSLKKQADAQKVWKTGASLLGDLDTHMDLIRLIKGESTPVSSSLSTPTASSTSPTNSTNTPVLPSRDDSQLQITAPRAKLPKDMDSETASTIVAAKGLVQHGIGDVSVDEKIARGYLSVNTGNFAQAIQIFTALLKQHPNVVAAYLGRGTAFALGGDLDSAIIDFSAAIQVNPSCIDAWKRRGQSRAARGYDNDAIADLTKALELESNDHEALHQRGLVYYKQKNYKRALGDFKKAASIDKMNKLSYNHMGLCLNAIGSPFEAIDAHAKAIQIDADFKEAWTNMAQAYKDLGVHDKAEQLFTKAISMDKNYVSAYYLRGMCRFAAGEHFNALEDLKTSLKLDPSQTDCRHMKGVVEHGVGMLRDAIATYSSLLAMKPEHVCWYNREVALFVHHHMDVPLTQINMDIEMDKYFKESWCKRNHPAILARYQPQPPLNNAIADVATSKAPASPATFMTADIINRSRSIGEKLQLNSPGYLPNKRQHAACGLAVLELAQKLRSVWRTKDCTEIEGKASSGIRTPHPFGWRDMYDILVKWRQISEPNDPVWWVDLLSPEQFEEGFGSHTPMITGQTNVVRYYPMFQRAFPIMKALIPEQCNDLTDDMKKAVAEAKDSSDLYEIMRRDFWVVTPCHSTAVPNKIMEGTRLTLQYAAPEGFEYSIRTPGTPPRWKEYDHELTHIWNLLSAEASKPQIDLDKTSDLILTMTFYWYNFMPLSRGTAAVGYMGLLAMFLAIDVEISANVPKDVQVDWEGILTPKPEQFISALSPWMYPSRKPTDISLLPDVAATFPTIRSIIDALNIATLWKN